MSFRVMETLGQFTPEIEVYSIDEAFLNLSGMTDNLLPYGRLIRQTVTQWTGIPISIGIGETKTLAKLANRLAKRTREAHGVIDLTAASHREKILAQMPVDDIWGIGPSYSRRLKANNIQTAFQLQQTNDRWIWAQMGVVGLQIVWELRGISCFPSPMSATQKEPDGVTVIWAAYSIAGEDAGSGRNVYVTSR